MSQLPVLSYPLSPMQRGMLFHRLYAQDSGVDVEQIVCETEEEVTSEAWLAAWDEAIREEPILRTRFGWESEDKPMQMVVDNIELPFSERNLEDLAECDQEKAFKEFLEEDRRQGFDLTVAPLMRVSLFRLGRFKHRLVWTFFHGLMDGRSFPIVLEKVFRHYENIQNGRIFERASSERQVPVYKEFVDWLSTQDVNDSEDYWRERLRGLQEPTQLPRQGNNPSRNQKQKDVGECEATLRPETLEAMTQFASENNITLNTLVHGAWSLLLNAYSGDDEILYGAVRACRHSSVPSAQKGVGLYINTVPIRVSVHKAHSVRRWLQEMRQQHLEVRPYEHTPLEKVKEWSEISGSKFLFESIIVFDSYDLDEMLRSSGGLWKKRHFQLHERTGFPITLYATRGQAFKLKIAYEKRLYSPTMVEDWLRQLKALLADMPSIADMPVGEVSVLTGFDRRRLAYVLNETRANYSEADSLLELFRRRAADTPDATALVFREESVTFGELERKSSQVARYLRRRGVKKGDIVGISIDRSIEMVVALYGIMKADAAYLPLDPGYPSERLRFMIHDAKLRHVITTQALAHLVWAEGIEQILLDNDWPTILEEASLLCGDRVDLEQLAYVIYTSGSTGRPKGVMVTHRNVANFLVGMRELLGREKPGVWLAVTSISFDISALELYWALGHGFKVVIAEEGMKGARNKYPGAKHSNPPIRFSLFYFSGDQGEHPNDKYRLLMEGARFADRNGFEAIWTPERHFHEFGGLYPNPSVTSAAIAAMTQNVKIRAGSVVLPLHNPVRVAEEWSMVDNISAGRVGISIAPGWQGNDFVLSPGNFVDRKRIMYRNLGIIRRLWRGEELTLDGPESRRVPIRLLPQPIQKELPIWVTAAGSPETFRAAGEIGANLLTHLLGQSIDGVREKLGIYRRAWRDSGHGERGGHVTLMLHTFLGEDLSTVREQVREPFSDYLRTSLDLVKKAPYTFPTFKVTNPTIARKMEKGLKELSESEIEEMVAFAFERYFESSGLFGTPMGCLGMIEKLKKAGIDEVGCLIDFGVESKEVISSLERLGELQELSRPSNPSVPTRSEQSFAELVERHGITHLQCTPSMVQMLVAGEEGRQALGSIGTLLVGGEALPIQLAGELKRIVKGRVLNMYGPTETTVWSTAGEVDGAGECVSIGRPIANTQVFVLDSSLRLVPSGVPGELYIGGEGVTKGYLGRPELTAEKFVNTPFGEYFGGRLYRTGDLVRYGSDGTLEFLGRIDNQVKVRGHRIELGEIEKVIGEFPGVAEAIVMARGDNGDKKIIGYWLPHAGAKVWVKDLRDALNRRLPDYMVPTYLKELEELPLTPNKKIDYNALPSPSHEATGSECEYVPPSGKVEEKISIAFKEVLGVEKIGRDDNFFDLGANSLLMVQVMNRLNGVLSKRTLIVDLFRFPTLRRLAEHLSDAEDAEIRNAGDERGRLRREVAKRRRSPRSGITA